MIDNLLIFIMIATMLVIIPGVDFLLVTKNTLNYGKHAGHFTTLGILLGLTVWTILAVLGLATIVANSIILFTIIKYLGAIYLLWLGVQALLARKSTMADLLKPNQNSSVKKHTYRSCFAQGALNDLLNPKTLLVYMTLMPQFINTNNSITPQLITLAVILMVISVVWFIIIVFILDIIRGWFLRPSVQSIFNKATGVMLIFLGICVALEEKTI
ncbi:LysE family translocator [Solibacillus sp. FSL H8-0538]|uniref:LysE family translocator n=1 Tax=Solibacillus sp. FSL H8-0538 TaxID=2921400 RepID=UPI0030FCBD9E